MELENEVLKLTCDLYKNVKCSRSGIDYIIKCFQNFIAKSYNPFLLKEINEILFKAISQEATDAIKRTFTKYKDPFTKFDSEDKRFKLYKHLGLYSEPDICILKEENVPKLCQNKVYLQKKTSSMIHIPLKCSLVKLFTMDGLLKATVAYKNSLQLENNLLSNVIQGSLWKTQMQNFIKKHPNIPENAIVVPLDLFFDDLETGDAVGYHAGKNQIGTVYSTIPCFPRNFSSKLDSIVLTDIFYSSDRKAYGNTIIFEALIKELNELEENGIDIKVNNSIFKIYFITHLVLGDNKGLNSILGFTESFTLTHFCRICYAGPNDTKTLTEEKQSLLRTTALYEEDIKNIKTSETGVKESCVFHGIKTYNVITNANIDLMHDVLEGVANYVMANILLNLGEKYYSIAFLNNVLKTVDFSFESSNKPVAISFDYIKANHRLKMSAAESLFFTRYFGLMMGENVPKDNENWLLYIKLREIISIVTSPDLLYTHILQLQILIKEHHTLYIKLFGDLKPKLHMLIHYPRLILQNGPLIHTSSMRFESKHREIKTALQVSYSNRNILQTVGIRHQLNLMHFHYFKYKNMFVSMGPEVEDDEVNFYFSSAKIRKTVSNVTINDFTYKSGIIFVVDILENGPLFGNIVKVFVVDNDIFFSYKPYKVIGFNKHYFAFSVIEDADEKNYTNYDSITSRVPCLLFNKEGTSYIATRYIL